MDESKLPTPHNNLFHYALSHAQAARDLIQTHLPADPMTCFQLLRYMVRIWEQRLRNGQSLCPVFPLVVYHGQEAWSAPVSLEELIGGPRKLFEYGVRLAYPVLDIGRIPDKSLAREPFLQSILGLLKYGRSRDFKYKLEFLLRCLLEGGDGDLSSESVDTFGGP